MPEGARLQMLVSFLQGLLRRPWLLLAVLVIDATGFIWGIVYWYGRQLPGSPIWSWPFVPDCPLFGLVGGLALLFMVGREWSPGTRRWVRGALIAIGVGALLLWGATLLLGGRASALAWVRWLATFDAMLGLLAGLCLITAAVWHRTPNGLLSIAAMGQIKYGIWTVFAWVVFWWNTNGFFTPESIFMTATHLAMIAQGLMLLTYYQPSRRGALIAGSWFLLSDFVDYGLGYYPRLPKQVPVSIMQWHTILVSLVLTGVFWRMAGYRGAFLAWMRTRSSQSTAT